MAVLTPFASGTVMCFPGFFRFGFGPRQLAQFTDRQALMDQERYAGQRSSGKRDDPKYHGDRRRRFLLNPKYFGQADETGDLRSATHSGKLQNRSDQSYRQQKHGA